jgi:hypothetical protein
LPFLQDDGKGEIILQEQSLQIKADTARQNKIRQPVSFFVMPFALLSLFRS